MSSREKRRKMKREPSPESKPTLQSSSPIPSLPYDLVLLCVARVSRLYYPTLSLVSKSFRSLVSSLELYKTRSLFGFTESCLYVCLQTLGVTTDWYTLCLKPNHNINKTFRKTKTGLSGYALARVPAPTRYGSVVAVGSNIYNIAFPHGVSILDCKSHSGWIEATPSLPVELHSCSASVVDHKIYVAGFDHRLKKNSLVVFDTETGVWDSLSTSSVDGRFYKEKTVSIDGKFHVVTDEEELIAYDPKQGKWDMVKGRMGWCVSSDDYCVIGNVLYSASEGVIRWYDSEKRRWRDLLGLVELTKIITGDDVRGTIRLGDYGGKMVVSWGTTLWPYYRKIWCAEIALERRPGTREIWGKVDWFDELLKVDIYSQVEKVLSVTL